MQKLQSVVCKITMRTMLNYKRIMNRTTVHKIRYTTLHYIPFFNSTVSVLVISIDNWSTYGFNKKL